MNKQAVGVNRLVLDLGGRKKLITYVTTDGQFLGQLEVIATSNEALRAMAHDFPNYVAEATRAGIVVAPGNVLPKAKS